MQAYRRWAGVHRPADDIRSALLSLHPPVLVIPHVNADLDAVASAVAVQTYLRHHGISAALFFPSLSAPAARVLKDLALRYSTDAQVKNRDVVVVDTSSTSMLPIDVYPARRLVVLDHHRGGDLRGFIFDTPSLSEVVADLLLSEGIRDERTYFLLALGIYSDTAGLLSARADTLSVLSSVLGFAGVSSISDIVRVVDYRGSVSERVARLKALRRHRIHRFGDYIVVTSTVGAFEGSVAWELVRAGADLSFVAGRGRVIGRASEDFISRTDIDLLDVFSRLSEELGGSWGGHPAAAGIHVDDPGKALETILSVVGNLLREKGHAFVRRDY